MERCQMTRQEATAFVEKAFETLQARGWLAEGLKPALAMEEEIDAFEKKRGVRLSPLYRALLLSHPIGQLMTIMYHLERVSPLWMELDGAVSMEALEEQIEILQEFYRGKADGVIYYPQIHHGQAARPEKRNWYETSEVLECMLQCDVPGWGGAVPGRVPAGREVCLAMVCGGRGGHTG